MCVSYWDFMNEAIEKWSAKDLITFLFKKSMSDILQQGLTMQKCHHPMDFKSIIAVCCTWTSVNSNTKHANLLISSISRNFLKGQ